MNKMRLIAVSAAFLTAGAGSAFAADLGTPIPAYEPPPVYTAPATFSWTGPYVGALLGYGFAGNWAQPAGAVAVPRGIQAGAFVGYNIQNGNWVLGGEADGTWNNINTGVAGDRIRWQSTLRGRVGYAANRFLVYGTGGLAIAGITETAGAPLVTANSTQVGFAVGAGVEAAFTDRLFGRAEYLYSNYGATPQGALQNHAIRVGLGVKF